MAATNEEVSAAQFPILIYVFSAIIILCLLTFRSFRATLAITLPLGLVSLLAYALMTQLQIGLKVSTLPVVALGVGVGVDYGIYIYSRFQSHLNEGMTIYQAYHETLKVTGSGVLITGITLAIGTATWIFSPLQFQADMGILLTFMFLLNMLGALFLSAGPGELAAQAQKAQLTAADTRIYNRTALNGKYSSSWQPRSTSVIAAIMATCENFARPPGFYLSGRQAGIYRRLRQAA